MNKSTVVKVQNISKTYKLYDKPIDRVKESLNPFKKKYHKEFHALDNVSFELQRGEALGVIGRNGNGKSTLLKIISGVLTPTKGHINTKGKISAILELTSNLKPELTGLQNIELNLKISGFKQSELKEKIKEIEEFAEIGEFIKHPVKTYSSGMKSRLGFGIATSIEPEILILDEVLAVGDFNYRQKCLSKINAMRDDMSIIFVSHSMNDIRMFCDKVLILEKGNKIFHGNLEDGISIYLKKDEEKKSKLKSTLSEKTTFYGDIFHNKKKIHDVEHYWIDRFYNKIENARTGSKIGIYIKFKLNFEPIDLIIGLPIWDINGNYITGKSSEMDGFKIDKNKDGFYEIFYIFDNILNPNQYINIISIVDKSEVLYRQKNAILNVTTVKPRYFGFINLQNSWRLSKEKLILNIENCKLLVNYNDNSGLSYDSKGSYEELNNKLYDEIKNKYNPDTLIDIGANYGFISLVLNKYFSLNKTVLVEASKKLVGFIDKNMKENSVENYEIINAICAEINNDNRSFANNPWNSQDNRVKGEKNWRTETVNTVSLNHILKSNKGSFYFIKIDTQGYEQNVFLGGEEYLTSHSNWIIKTEFAPYWIKSQGFNVRELLKYLLDRYIVSESPKRVRYSGDNIANLIKNQLTLQDIDTFIEYIIKYDKNDRGWTDLYIFPKSFGKV